METFDGAPLAGAQVSEFRVVETFRGPGDAEERAAFGDGERVDVVDVAARLRPERVVDRVELAGFPGAVVYAVGAAAPRGFGTACQWLISVAAKPIVAQPAGSESAAFPEGSFASPNVSTA